jgi:Raf kinase inhibitor-like YbhB/YbcL family protein
MKHQGSLKFTSALILVALASCGAKNHATNQMDGGRSVENATLTKLSLTSDAFQNQQAIPAHHTCDGGDQSPPLSWGEPPQGTKSFALVIDDPDAPSGTFHHWGAFDIAPSTRRIGAGQQPGTQAVNDFGNRGYGGPCPPKGHGPHHYHFKLFALDVDRLSVGPNAKVIDVENEASKHTIARGELIGTYERK